MKVLSILQYSPIPANFGGALRVYHLSRWLSRHHELSMLVFAREEARPSILDAFDGRLKELRIVPPPGEMFGGRKRVTQLLSFFRSQSAFASALQSREMEVAFGEMCRTTPYDVIFPMTYAFGFLPFNGHDARLVIDTQEVEWDHMRRFAATARSPLRRIFYASQQRKILREEVRLLRRANAVLATCERDKILFDAELPEVPKFVVPNGVETSYFSPSDAVPEPSSLVFTGAMSYFPNVDAVEHFVRDILPAVRARIPEVKFYVVGKDPPRRVQDLASDAVVVTGRVEDVRPFVWKSSVYVVPLRMGGGTRLKVLEALSMKKPVVTTSIGCEGIDVVHNDSVIIADRAGEFADAVIRMLQDRAAASRLAERGYQAVKEHYDWERIGGRLEKAIGSLFPQKGISSRV